MFCPKCGSEIPEGAKFCGSCGAPVEDAGPVIRSADEPGEMTETGKKMSTRNWIVIGVIAIAVVVVIVLCISLSGGYKRPLKKYLNGMQNFNAKDIVDAIPSFMYEGDGYTKSEIIEEEQDELDWEKMYVDEMDSYKLTYNIGTARDCGSYEFNELLDDLAWYYDLSDEDLSKVKKAKVVDVEITEKYTDYGEQYEDSYTLTFYVGKIGSNWYVLDYE